MMETKTTSRPLAKGKLTSIEIARLVGVAPSTVSRVLNRAGGFSKQTERRVLEAVSATGYKPSSAASSLSRQTHETVGLITEIDNADSYYGPQLIHGVSLELSDSSQRLAMGTVSRGGDAAEIEQLPLFRERSVDGFIFDVHATVGDVQSMANRLAMPHVFVNPPYLMPSNTVMPDDVDDAQQTTEYLIRHGHRCIGYFPSVTTQTHSSQANRMKGYLQAIVKAGLSPLPMWDVPMIKAGERLEPEEYIPRLKMYREQHGCTAVVTYHAMAAACVLSACYMLGIRVPRDLSIIACDDDPMLSYTPVKLSSIHLDRVKMGRQAVRMVLRQIKDSVISVPTLLVNGELRERASVAAPS